MLDWLLEVITENNTMCPTTEEHTDVVELSALMQCLGFSVKSISTGEETVRQESGGRTVTIYCQASGLHVVLESGCSTCSCPPEANQHISSLRNLPEMADGQQQQLDKEGWTSGADVCRLLLCLSAVTRGAGAVRRDVNSYLHCCVLTFSKAVVDKDAPQLLQAYTLLNELCQDANLRNLIASVPSFCLTEPLKNLVEFCNGQKEVLEPEEITSVVQNALKFLSILVNLDLYPLRKNHCQMLCLCLITHPVCLSESLELFSSIIFQYKDEGQLPEELILMISAGLSGLLVPPTLEPGKAGLQWLQVVGALCETGSTQEQVVRVVMPDAYEEILYSVLQYSSQNGSVGVEQGQQAAVLGYKTALALTPLLQAWRAALQRMLLNNQVRKMLCTGLCSGGARGREILKLMEQMEEVFEEAPTVEGSASPRGGETESEAWQSVPQLTTGQEHAVDALVRDLTDALRNNKMSDIATSSLMELYGYKMACLEQRLHSQTVALQGASEHMASLQHSLAMIQAFNSSQQDVLYTTQMQNENPPQQPRGALLESLTDAEQAAKGLRQELTTIIKQLADEGKDGSSTSSLALDDSKPSNDRRVCSRESGKSDGEKSKEKANKSASMVKVEVSPDASLVQAETSTRHRSLDTLTAEKEDQQLPTPSLLQKKLPRADTSTDKVAKNDKKKTMCRSITYTVSSPSSVKICNKMSSSLQQPRGALLESLTDAEQAAEGLRQELATIIKQLANEGKNDSSTSSLALDLSKISLKVSKPLEAQFASSPNRSGVGTFYEDMKRNNLLRSQTASPSLVPKKSPNNDSGVASKIRRLSPNFYQSKSSLSSKNDKLKPQAPENNKLELSKTPNLSASKKRFSHVKSTIPKPAPKKK